MAMSVNEAKALLEEMDNDRPQPEVGYPGHAVWDGSHAQHLGYLRARLEARRVVQQADPDWLSPMEAEREDLAEEAIPLYELREEESRHGGGVSVPTAGPKDPKLMGITVGELRERRVIETSGGEEE